MKRGRHEIAAPSLTGGPGDSVRARKRPAIRNRRHERSAGLHALTEGLATAGGRAVPRRVARPGQNGLDGGRRRRLPSVLRSRWHAAGGSAIAAGRGLCRSRHQRGHERRPLYLFAWNDWVKCVNEATAQTRSGQLLSKLTPDHIRHSGAARNALPGALLYISPRTPSGTGMRNRRGRHGDPVHDRQRRYEIQNSVLEADAGGRIASSPAQHRKLATRNFE